MGGGDIDDENDDDDDIRVVDVGDTPKWRMAIVMFPSSSSGVGGSSHDDDDNDDGMCLDGTQLQRKTRSFLRCDDVMDQTSDIDDDGTHAYIGALSGLRHPGVIPRGSAAAFCDWGW